ncbi:Predicted arabinose efflux permease, MFS family [Psychrobacillus psychrotolerans]|uniref:Predicted arabinose efflux permease, MFS family n=1 Tax=Psychrobacillus psychrotolerans TaxID=126156 RepID=A0A1I6A4E1_9BACI|nr:MFS transporter [Psychrobacillus psychrotolerans]SFQ63407.1 Predicted arabinose efflux permease, MFS family [Psychrobacillus psychrotolerans]
MSVQKRNFTIMWFSIFLVSATMTMIMPFLSLYINTMGDFSEAYVQKWSGLVFGATFVSAFLMSPIWGRIADKYGYKPILIINGFGIAISVLLMGFVNSVEAFFVLRLFMGIVTGFIPTSLAFISSQTPKKIAGKTMGTLQMGSVSGTLFGPIIGGLLADTFGFQYTFMITATAVSIAALIVLFGIHEIRKEKKEGDHEYSRKTVISSIFHHRLVLNVLMITSLIQIGLFSIQPLLSLYVSQLTNSKEVALLAGITFSATGVGSLLFARTWGKLGDSIGYEKILSFLLIIAFVFIVPQAFVTELWQLIILRFLFGIASGGLIPITTALIRREAPIEVQGELMGYNTSFRFLGNIIGPMFGGFISGYIGISSVFFVTGALFLIAFVIIYYARKKPRIDFEDVLIEEEMHAKLT